MPNVFPKFSPRAARRLLPRPERQSVGGYSLIELLIGIVLGLVAVGALFTVFLSSRTSYRRDEQIAQVQENARFALDALTRDLQNGGYWGGLLNAPDIQNNMTFESSAQALVPVTVDCGPANATTGLGWVFDFTQAFYFRNQADSTSVATRFPCLAGASIAPNTDIVGIKRTDAQPQATSTDGTLIFTRQALSLVTSSNSGGASTVGLVLQPANTGTSIALSTLNCTTASGSTTSCQPQGGPVAAFRLLPSVYYVRTYTRKPNDGVPALCRQVLRVPQASGMTPYVDECVATGVENLQVEWGVSSLATPNTIDHYTSAPLATDFSGGLIISARIFLLMRSAETQVGSGGSNTLSNDPRIYTMADFSSAPDNRLTANSSPGGDSFYRKLYTVTVQLKNARLPR